MNNVPMISAISTSTSTCMCSASSFAVNKANPFTLSTSAIPNIKLQNFRFSALISQLGLSPFSQWNGLRPLDVSISRQSVKIGEGKCKGKTVFASLFGVGAPEALVIGVVALLVFGPKGLAEVARNLGKTLRAFQPAIKELQDVSREFKSTLEQEIGLDEIQSSTQNISRSNKTQTTSSTSSIASSEESRITDPNGSASTKQAYSSEEYLKVTEQQLKAASVAQQQSQIDSPGASQLDSETKSQDTVQKTAAVMPPPQKPETET